MNIIVITKIGIEMSAPMHVEYYYSEREVLKVTDCLKLSKKEMIEFIFKFIYN